LSGNTNQAFSLVCIELNPGPKKSKNHHRTNNSSAMLAINHNANPFRGVIRAIDEKDNSQTYRHRLVGSAAVPATVTGVNVNIPLNSVQSAQDWASFATLYDEFRVLGLRLHYQPRSRYTQASLGINVYYDNDNTAVTPSSNNIAASYANSRFLNTSSPWTYDGIFSFTRDGPEAWQNTSNPSSQLGMVGIFQSQSFGGTINAGDYVSEYIVEFRGRR
jgi:hypothetical protein